MAALRAVLAFALVGALALAGCSTRDRTQRGDGGADPGDDGDDRPTSEGYTMHVGDRWTHRTVGGGFESTTVSEVKAIEDHKGVEAFRVEGTITNTAEGTTSTGDSITWNRRSDLATLAMQTVAHTTYMGYTADTESSTTFDPPCPGIPWPLRVGQTWTTTCTATTTVNGHSATATTSSNATVEGTETITVPAGTFATFRIVTDSGGEAGTSTAWIAAEACGMVKSVATAQGQTVTTELTEVDC